MTTSQLCRKTAHGHHVVGLDVIRFTAATLVMSYHLAFWDWTHGQPFARMGSLVAPAWGARLHFGWVGVEIFFVISGFVIAYSGTRATSHAFLMGRILRLAPASWIGATLVFFLKAQQATQPVSDLSSLYIETLAFWPLNAIDGVWWTLGIEVSFYGLVYLLIRIDRAAALESVVVGIGLLSGLFWCAALVSQTMLDGGTGTTAILHTLVLKAEGNRELQLLLVQHGCLFALGVVIWTASTYGLTRRRTSALAVLACACVLEIVGQNGIISRGAHMSLSPWPAMVAWAAAMMVLAASVLWNDRLIRAVGKGVAVVRFAGLTTYPLYLVHNVAAGAIVVALAPRLGVLSVGLGALGAIASATFIAGIVEPAIRKILAAVLDWRGSRSQHPASVQDSSAAELHDRSPPRPSSATVRGS